MGLPRSVDRPRKDKIFYSFYPLILMTSRFSYFYGTALIHQPDQSFSVVPASASFSFFTIASFFILPSKPRESV